MLLDGLREAQDHPDLNTIKGQLEYAIMSSLPAPIGIWSRMKDHQGQVWMIHKEDQEAVSKFANLSTQQVAKLPFKEKQFWFEQQLLRMRTPGSGTEIHLRRDELTLDSWNAISALTVDQMRADWTFSFQGETSTGDDAGESLTESLNESLTGRLGAGGVTREWFEEITKAVMDENRGESLTKSH